MRSPQAFSEADYARFFFAARAASIACFTAKRFFVFRGCFAIFFGLTPCLYFGIMYLGTN